MKNNNFTDGLVSIIMPNYNGEKYIAESIESVLKQSYRNWELIIIDDGSIDSSLNIINNYLEKDNRIKLIRQNNGGSAAARNNGIKNANGRYISLLDSDDIWLPDFLKNQLAFMKEKNAVCVYCSYQLIDENSNEIYSPVIAKNKVDLKKMRYRNYIGCLTGIYDSAKYGKIYLDEKLKSLLDDYAYWYKIVKLEDEAYGNSKILAKYRISNNSVSSNKVSLIRKHYKFYRTYLHLSKLHSAISTFRWGIAGIKKYS